MQTCYNTHPEADVVSICLLAEVPPAAKHLFVTAQQQLVVACNKITQKLLLLVATTAARSSSKPHLLLFSADSSLSEQYLAVQSAGA
jgi:hypothetical protein